MTLPPFEPHYPKAGRGRRPYPLSVLLRSHCVQLCNNFSDPAMEDLLDEEPAARDPEMHQTKKGNEPHFGMKLHIGVDADSGLCTA